MINRRRDTKTAAVLNTDVAALNKYKQERALYQKVQTLSTEVNMMKDLLSTVTQRLEKLENK
jgi:hypothetical protein